MTFLLDTNVVSELTKSVPDAKCLAWLAAIAREYGLKVVTRNAKHFRFVNTENPFV